MATLLVNPTGLFEGYFASNRELVFYLELIEIDSILWCEKERSVVRNDCETWIELFFLNENSSGVLY